MGDGGTVTNFGSIFGLAAQGVHLLSGGRHHGSVKDTAARSRAYCRRMRRRRKLRNFGTIFGASGVSGPVGAGVR